MYFNSHLHTGGDDLVGLTAAEGVISTHISTREVTLERNAHLVTP